MKLYCSVEVSGLDDLFSKGAKVKVYVVNSFVERQRYHLNEGSPEPETFMFKA